MSEEEKIILAIFKKLSREYQHLVLRFVKNLAKD